MDPHRSWAFRRPWHRRSGQMNLTTITESRATVLSGDLITTIAALTATLGAAAACWVFAIDQSRGMDMGVATRLGSLGFFAASWISMMAAMMLPGAVPAVLQRSRSGGVFTAPVFAGTYVAIWAIVGIAVYVLYRPHGTVAAG